VRPVSVPRGTSRVSSGNGIAGSSHRTEGPPQSSPNCQCSTWNVLRGSARDPDQISRHVSSARIKSEAWMFHVEQTSPPLAVPGPRWKRPFPRSHVSCDITYEFEPGSHLFHVEHPGNHSGKPARLQAYQSPPAGATWGPSFHVRSLVTSHAMETWPTSVFTWNIPRRREPPGNLSSEQTTNPRLGLSGAAHQDCHAVPLRASSSCSTWFHVKHLASQTRLC
jgi:hypothetical protein